MIRRMTDKLGHLTHGHPKPPQQQQLPQSIQHLPLPVTTLSHLEHRGSVSTQRTSESSKRGESVDDTRPMDESAFPYQRRQKGTYRLSDFYFQRTLGTGSFGRVHLGRADLLTLILTLTVWQSEANTTSGFTPSRSLTRKRSSSRSRSITRIMSSKCCLLCSIHSSSICGAASKMQRTSTWSWTLFPVANCSLFCGDPTYAFFPHRHCLSPLNLI